MSSWSHTQIYNIYSSVGSRFLISGSIADLKFRSINQFKSVFRCYRVEVYTTMHLTFHLQANFKQTHFTYE